MMNGEERIKELEWIRGKGYLCFEKGGKGGMMTSRDHTEIRSR
jgi:hypothetical protein